MASTSTSSIHKSFKYEVFLSFRGETRLNFVGHLFGALHEKNHIYTYKDDVRMEKSKEIADDLDESIKNSKFYIIVFSKDYPSSLWCLNELVTIMKCHKEPGHAAYPVFYDVKPFEVGQQKGKFGLAFEKLKKEMTFERYRKGAFDKAFPKLKEEMTFESNQNGSFGKVFAKLINEEKKAFKKWKKKVFREWGDALGAATAVNGWELEKTADRNEYIFVQKIVESLSSELRSTHVSTDKTLVGMESRIKDVLSSLKTSCDGVRMIGIKGMGGIGKTTLAAAVYDRISLQFKAKSFVEKVREVSNASPSGLMLLQNQVLSDVLNDQGMKVSSVSNGKNVLKSMLGGRKVLLVLDDVDHIDQLEALAGDPNWFKPGSVVIITTREEQVLIAHNVKLICNVSLLSDTEAICLFNMYAFRGDIPIQGFEELSEQVIHYAAGLPLTIRVLGSLLCGNDSKLEWTDAIERLKKIPLHETLKKLELSYMRLEEDQREIFLDVACIMKGLQLHRLIEALESRGFHARFGLRVLERKSLITIDDKGYVGMHDHIEEMGKDIVRRLYRDKPNIHSRLWIMEEIEDIFVNDLGTEAIRGIRPCTLKLDPQIVMKGLRKMTGIRFLHLSFGHRLRNYNDFSPYFPSSIGYLNWIWYPFRSLPTTYEANNLAVLRMPFSNIEQLWEAGEQKVLNKLRVLDLSCSRIRTLDLGLTPNLETLTLTECGNLIELLMSVACLSLRHVHLSNLRVALNLGFTPNLETLTLGGHDGTVQLYMHVEMLKLRSLELYDSRLTMLDLGLTPNLENLELRRCYDLVDVCGPTGCLYLKHIKFQMTNQRTFDLRLASNLETLELIWSKFMVELHMPNNCLNLKSIWLSVSKLRTLNIGLTPNLIRLVLTKCTYLEELNMAGECPKLEYLSITDSKLTNLDLRLTPNLKTLDLKQCYNLVQLHAPIGWLKELVYLVLSGCLGFRALLFRKIDYSSHRVDGSHELVPLVEVSFYLERCPLHPYVNFAKFEFTCFHKEDLPLLTTSLEKLLCEGPCACTKLETFSRSIYGLKR